MRYTQKELRDQLDRLNALMGTEFTMDKGPGGWKVETGRQERRRPAAEMFRTLDFAIDMVERMKRNHALLEERLDRFALYIVHNEDEDHEQGSMYLSEDDWDYITDVRADHHGEYGNFPPKVTMCPKCEWSGRMGSETDPSGETACDICEGRGSIPFNDDRRFTHAPSGELVVSEELVDCPECGGYGSFEEWEDGYIVFAPCYHCGATGKVPRGEAPACDRLVTELKPVKGGMEWPDGYVSYICENCAKALMRNEVCTDVDGNVYCEACYREA